MKTLSNNPKQGQMKLKLENLDDLWIVSTLINAGDKVSGKAFRKVSIGDSDNAKATQVKKPIYVTIEVEKVEFDSSVKVLGKVVSGPEDVPVASYQSITLNEGDEVEIQKEWLQYQLDKIKEAEKEKSNIVAVIYNREEAIFGKLEKNNFSVISKIKGDVEKKVEGQTASSNFFKTIAKELVDLNERMKPKHVIYASSHFWKNNLEEEMGDLKEKSIFAPVNDISENGFAELLTRNEIDSALQNQQAGKDAQLVEEVFEKIAKEDKVSYGEGDCMKAAELGAVEHLLCTENLIKEKRGDNSFSDLERIFTLTEKNGGTVHLISGDGEHVKRLDGIGGIGAFLRYPLN